MIEQTDKTKARTKLIDDKTSARKALATGFEFQRTEKNSINLKKIFCFLSDKTFLTHARNVAYRANPG